MDRVPSSLGSASYPSFTQPRAEEFQRHGIAHLGDGLVVARTFVAQEGMAVERVFDRPHTLRSTLASTRYRASLRFIIDRFSGLDRTRIVIPSAS